MKQPSKLLLAGIGSAIIAGFAGFTPASHGQAPAPAAALSAADAAAIAQVAAEIAEQQVKIVANQKLIDEKLAAIAENVRLAKIFVSRGGGAK